MGAYICDICDSMFCSHDVNFYHCDTCETSFCEGCWQERLHEDQEDVCDPLCGDCFAKTLVEHD